MNKTLGGEYTLDFLYGSKDERVLKTITEGMIEVSSAYINGLNDFPLMEKNFEHVVLVNNSLYVYGPTGLIAIKDGSTFNYILKDHLGSTRAVLNSSNIRVAKYHYSPYGKMMYAWVNTDVTYKFTGQERDDEFGLHNFRARLYDAELGMFYAYDPAAQGFSPFSYAGNSPVIYNDPTGKFILSALLPGIGTFIDAMLWGAVIGGTVQGITTNSWDGVWKGAIVGGVGGLLAPIGGAGLTFTQDVLLGGFEGAFTGSLNSILWNTDVGNGMLWGGISGAAFAALTSPYTKNLIQGEGFNSNSEVFDNMMDRGTDRQKILDYFGMEGNFDPNNSYFSEPNAANAFTDPSTGNIIYDEGAFMLGYDQLNWISHHELIHRQNILSGKYNGVNIDYEIAGMEEWSTYLNNYQNQGLYPNNRIDLIKRLNYYGMQAGIYQAVNTPNGFYQTLFEEKWWHFIYKIPRRF